VVTNIEISDDVPVLDSFRQSD